MSSPQYQPLDELRSISQLDLKLKVKITRKWNEPYEDNHPLAGVNLILIDKYSTRMHAWIPSDLINTLNEYLIEGRTYEIENFIITPYKGPFKCLKDDTKITLLESTSIIELHPIENEIPDQVFDFTNLEDIQYLSLKNGHCIDVLGIVEVKKHLDSFTNQKNEEEIYVDLVISDTITRINVRFLGTSAISCNRLLNGAAFQSLQPPVILISCAKVLKNRYNGKITISNAPPTSLFINMEHQAVTNLRNRFSNFKEKERQQITGGTSSN